MLTIITGSAGTDKSRLLYDRIAALAKEGKKSLLIVPDSMSHLAERRLLLHCGNTVSRYARVCTLSRLASDILAASGSKTKYLDGGGRVLSMYRAIASLKGRLCWFDDSVQRPALVSAMLDTVNEFIFSGISDSHPAFGGKSLSPKLRDIRDIYSAYMDVCRASGLDPAALMDEATEKMADSGLLTDQNVFFDDFSAYSEQKMRFILRIIRESRHCTFAIMTNGDRVTFCEQHKVIDRLTYETERKGGQVDLIRLPYEPADKPAALSALEQLFSPDKQPVSASDGVALYTARTEWEECQLAAALVRQKCIAQGARLREIAVVCGSEDGYSGLMEGAFARYGILCFFSRREDVLKKPAYAAALGGLMCLADNMRLDRVCAYLKSGMTGLTDDEVCLLENYALLWGISGKGWFEPFYKPTSGFERAERDEEQRLGRLEDMRRRAMSPLLDMKNKLTGTMQGSRFIGIFREFISDIRLRENIEQRISDLSDAGRLQEAQEYAQLYDILRGALEQFEAVCGELDMDIAEFTRLLRLTLSQYDVSSIPSSLDSVTFGSFARLSCFGIKHVIVLGAHSGALPPDAPSGSIIGEGERDQLEKEGIFLPRSADKALSRQSDVYRAFNAPTVSLTLIRPLTAADGSTLHKSYVVSYIQKLLPNIPEQQAETALRRLRLTAPDSAFELACSASANAPLPEAAAAREYLSRDEQTAQRLGYASSFALSPRLQVTDKTALRRLYGKHLSVSASGIDRFNSCRFSYFCQYGLGARERKEVDLGALEVGNMVHAIVEKAVKALCEGRETDCTAAVSRYAREYAQTLRGADTPRMQALLAQIESNAVMVVQDVWAEIGSSDFKPKYFELNFSFNGDVQPFVWEKDGFSFVLKGKIDRVDAFGDKLKVVDYKTGTKEYALGDILKGKNLQPFIYMLMLRQAGLGENCAALFLPAKAIYMDSDEPLTDGQAAQKRADTVRRMGLVRMEEDVLQALEHTEAGQNPRWLPVAYKKDGTVDTKKSGVASKSQMDRIIDYTQSRIDRFSAQVASGDVSVAPAGDTACRYCPYKAACFVNTRDVAAESPSVKTTDGVIEIIEREEEEAHGEI